MTLVSFPKSGGPTTDAQYAEFFSTFIGNGVRSVSDFQVTAPASGLAVNVSSGFAVVAGCAAIEDSSTPVLVSITPNTSGQSRRDTIVLRRDFSLSQPVMLVAKPGPGGSSGPSLTQIASGIWEMPLADVVVPSSAATISPSNITDRRALLPTNVQTWTNDTRPAHRPGLLGLNLSTGAWEFSDGSAWKSLSAVTAAQITDATTIGRTILKAADAAAVRAAIGGTVGQALMAAANASAARDVIGGTVGKTIMGADNAATVRAAISGSYGQNLMAAASVTAAREALRIFKGNGPSSPQTDDLRYRDV